MCKYPIANKRIPTLIFVFLPWLDCCIIVLPITILNKYALWITQLYKCLHNNTTLCPNPQLYSDFQDCTSLGHNELKKEHQDSGPSNCHQGAIPYYCCYPMRENWLVVAQTCKIHLVCWNSSLSDFNGGAMQTLQPLINSLIEKYLNSQCAAI